MKRIFFGLLILVTLVHFASSQAGNVSNEILNLGAGISAVNYINIEIGNNGLVTVEEEVIANNTIAGILIPLNVDVISVSDSKNRLKYDLLPGDGKQLLTFYLLSPIDKTLRIRYTTQHLTSKNGSIWTLKFFASVTPHYTIVNVKSPADSGIISLRPDIPRYPANLSNPMWLYPQTNELYFEIDYQTMKGVQPPKSSNNANYEFLILIIVIVFSIASYILLTKKKPKKEEVKEEIKITKKEEDIVVLDKKNSQSEFLFPKNHKAIFGPNLLSANSGPISDKVADSGEKKEDNAIEEKNKRKINDSVIKILDESERKILELLEVSEDEITQAYVYKTTGIPKATLSDIMQRLEKRNIIERRKNGRLSWIKLKDWVFE